MEIRSGYKITELGEIPDNWRISKIGDECTVGTGGTPSTRNQAYYRNGTIPWLISTELNFGLITSAQKYITEKGLRESNARIYPKGSLVIAMIGLEAPGTRGRCAILGIDAATSQSCAVIQSKGSIHLGFLFYFYQSLGDKILALAEGTKRQGLNLDRVRSIKIPVPSDKEQQKIASIFSLLDNSIKKSGEIIAKMEQLKKGLRQHLLTRGIGHIRFKQSQLGRLPETWQVVRLGDVCVVKTSFPPFNQISTFDTNNESDDLVLAAKVSDLSNRTNQKYIVTAKQSFRYRFDKTNESRFLRPGSIVFPKRGAAIGKNRKRITKYYSILDPNLIGVEPSDTIDSQYLFEFFESFDLISIQDMTTIPQFNKRDVERILLPLPPFPEQQAVASMLSAIHEKIETEMQTKEQVEHLKKGLMNDLLTGKVGVKVT
jgi:type I restriction enzyme S subunit